MGGVLAPVNAHPKYTIAYSGFEPLNTDIFIADADGRNPKPFLADPAQDFNASFSRDGKWIVFTSERHGSADIYRAHPDGTGLERLTDDPSFDDQAALSPDGRTVAFVSSRSGHAEIWTLDLATRKVRNITNHAGGHFRPAWSPDGQWIAISSDRDSPQPHRPDGFELIQQTEIYLLHPDGSGLRRLTHTNSYAGSPSWSPDGKQIVFYKASFGDVIGISDPRHLRATTQIAQVNVASGQEKELTQGKGEKWSPRWLADGRIGYFSGDQAGAVVLRCTTKTHERFAANGAADDCPSEIVVRLIKNLHSRGSETLPRARSSRACNSGFGGVPWRSISSHCCLRCAR